MRGLGRGAKREVRGGHGEARGAGWLAGDLRRVHRVDLRQGEGGGRVRALHQAGQAVLPRPPGTDRGVRAADRAGRHSGLAPAHEARAGPRQGGGRHQCEALPHPGRLAHPGLAHRRHGEPDDPPFGWHRLDQLDRSHQRQKAHPPLAQRGRLQRHGRRQGRPCRQGPAGGGQGQGGGGAGPGGLSRVRAGPVRQAPPPDQEELGQKRPQLPRPALGPRRAHGLPGERGRPAPAHGARPVRAEGRGPADHDGHDPLCAEPGAGHRADRQRAGRVRAGAVHLAGVAAQAGQSC